jgi:hypothetical protein
LPRGRDYVFTKEKEMKKKDSQVSDGLSSNRRSFLKRGAAAAGAATMGVGLLNAPSRAFAQEHEGGNGRINRGDAAILRFLQALETIEADIWRQYAELGGAGANVPGTVGNSPVDLFFQGAPIPTALAPLYVVGLQQLDADMPQYINDNTDDELSHESFLRAYLEGKDEPVANLSKFFDLTPSQVPGVPNTGRLTNLTQLTVNTTWWTRYRSDSKNPDLGDSFDHAIPTLAVGQHTAIPRTNKDLIADPNQPGGVSMHTQAIANTAGFHFAWIEQGGTSLYPQLAQRVTNVEVLRVLLSIGPSEVAHFQTWQDKAGNAIHLTDTDTGFPGSTGATVTFPDLNAFTDPKVADEFQTNLIMPEPTFFLNKRFGPVSIIRPTETRNAATAALQSFIDGGLFIGHTSKSGKSDGFVELLRELAADADEARRELD